MLSVDKSDIQSCFECAKINIPLPNLLIGFTNLSSQTFLFINVNLKALFKVHFEKFCLLLKACKQATCSLQFTNLTYLH